MRLALSSRCPSPEHRGMVQRNRWRLSFTLPPVQNPLDHEYMAICRLEVRALPEVLPSGTLHLERTPLLSASVDAHSVASRRYAVSLCRLPLQPNTFTPWSGAKVLG